MNNPELKMYQQARQQGRTVAGQNRLFGGVIDRPGAGGAGLDISVFAFGYSASENIVTVSAGKVRHGTRAAVAVAAAPVTIAADHTFIWVDYTYAGTAAIGSGTTEPSSTVTNLLVPLHQWKLTNGIVSIEKIFHLGDIIIPGEFA